MKVDHHVVAGISIAGSCLDVLGGLYLAYDILGGEHGPLRLLTRAVTYSILFGLGYGLGLGTWFGIVAGIATGATIAAELHRASRGKEHFSLPAEALCSAIRGVAFGIGLYQLVGFRFAAVFAAMITGGQIVAYSRDVRPSLDYMVVRRPNFTRRHFSAAVVRTVGYISAALICSALVHHLDHPWLFALRVGLVTGIVTGFGNAVYPFIEYYADHLPERRMGAFGICLILLGFSLQSVQYWISLLDVTVV